MGKVQTGLSVACIALCALLSCTAKQASETDAVPAAGMPAAGEIPAASAPIELPTPRVRTVGAEREQEAQKAIPNSRKIPLGQEEPRWPSDFLIGLLESEGTAPDLRAAATDIAQGLVKGSGTELILAQVQASERRAITATLAEVSPESARIASVEPRENGEYAALVRFMGKERAVCAELFLARQEGAWTLQDIYFDEVVSIIGEGVAQFDPFSYKKFF